MRRWLTKISGEHIAFTGRAWRARENLQRRVQQQGGYPTPGGEVTGVTTVLVRGSSPVWAHGDHGLKEMRAAQLIRAGHPVAVVDDTEFRKLLKFGRPAKISDRVSGQPTEWLNTSSKQQFEEAAAIAGPLDREHNAKGRVEQGFLRRMLFGDMEEAECSICRRKWPLSLLVAAHIKPRRDCTRRERLDAKNIVISVCLLGCDALYERGLIAVGIWGRDSRQFRL